MNKRSYPWLKLFSWLGLLAALTLVGCSAGGSEPASDPQAIENIVWQWASLTDQTTGEVMTVPNPEKYTMIFRQDGTVQGQADCNSFSGTYSTASGFSITLGPTTQAFCGEDSLDQQYLSLLGSIVAGGPDGAGGFALETAGGAQRMEFRNSGPAPEA